MRKLPFITPVEIALVVALAATALIVAYGYARAELRCSDSFGTLVCTDDEGTRTVCTKTPGGIVCR